MIPSRVLSDSQVLDQNNPPWAKTNVQNETKLKIVNAIYDLLDQLVDRACTRFPPKVLI
jgi:hypothetical protein